MKGTFPGIALQVLVINSWTVAVGAVPLTAQDAHVYLDAGVSHARPPSELEADPSTYAQLSGRLLIDPLFASVYGGVALDDAAADWIGGTLAASAEFRGFRKPGFGITGLVSAFSVGEPNDYDAVNGRIIPELYVPLGAPTLVLRGHVGAGESKVTDATSTPPQPVTADLWIAGGGIELVGAVSGTRLWGGLEAFDATGGTFVAGYAGSSGNVSRAVWSAALKVWDTPDEVEVELSLGVAIPVGHAWSLQTRAGRVGPDPLLDTPASVDASVSFTWDVLAPLVEPQPVYSIGSGQPPTVTFRLEAAGAETVSLVGDFSGWEPIPMRRGGKAWIAEVELPPGLYHFGFLVDGSWHVPDNAPGRVADEFGRTNATLVISGDPGVP